MEQGIALARKHVGPIAEVGKAIGGLAGEDARKVFLEGFEAIERSSGEDVARWLAAAMERLDAGVDEETRIRIMESCGFNCAEHNRKHIETSRRRRERFPTLDAFLEAEEKKPATGTRIRREGSLVHQYYTPSAFRGGLRCYCSLWRSLPVDQSTSLTWCHCSKGFVMKLWEAYLGRMPRVELLRSCIAGDGECEFLIHLDP